MPESFKKAKNGSKFKEGSNCELITPQVINQFLVIITSTWNYEKIADHFLQNVARK